MMFKNDAHEEEPGMQGSLDDNKQSSQQRFSVGASLTARYSQTSVLHTLGSYMRRQSTCFDLNTRG